MRSIVWLLNLEEQIGNIIPSPHQGLGPLLKETLERAGYMVKMSNDAGHLGDFSFLISADLDENRVEQVTAYPREKCFLIATEPPTVVPLFHSQIVKERFGKIFTLLQRYVDNQTYFKIHHPITQKTFVSAEAEAPFGRKKFCCMVQGNKQFYPNPGELYTERNAFALSFSKLAALHAKEFDIYGPGWNGFRSWKGLAPTNKALLANYKFTMCYENTFDQPGFITERIFNSFLSRNIPIYLGAPDITDYVPKECFIDARDFGGRGIEAHQKIWQYLQDMDETTYRQYIEAGQRYVFYHPNYKLFSVENIVSRIMAHIPKVV